MIYNNIHKGIFKNRPNRFIAEVEIDGKVEICHVKNTGRCKELLISGATVYANYADNPSRATKYDLIAVEKGELLINMDSYAPNIAFGEYLQQGKFFENVTLIKPEAKYGASRFDFYVETARSKAFIEVKGVTLEDDGVALFPDAPTTRGVKHMLELAQCLSDGYEAMVVFVVQMRDVRYFSPNTQMHSAFSHALTAAGQAGVHIFAFDCHVTENSMTIGKAVPVRLSASPI